MKLLLRGDQIQANPAYFKDSKVGPLSRPTFLLMKSKLHRFSGITKLQMIL